MAETGEEFAALGNTAGESGACCGMVVSQPKSDFPDKKSDLLDKKCDLVDKKSDLQDKPLF